MDRYPERRDGDDLFLSLSVPGPSSWRDVFVGLLIGGALLAAYWWSGAL